VTSKTSDSFWSAYRALPVQARSQARKAFKLFTKNPQHPSLHFKELKGYPHIFSVRINRDYRVVGLRKGESITWFWVGTHAEFDSRFA